MGKTVKKVVSFAAPIVGNLIAPGIGGLIGGAIGGAVSGGGIKSIAFGAAGGYVGGGGLGSSLSAGQAGALGGALSGYGQTGDIKGALAGGLTGYTTAQLAPTIVGNKAGTALDTASGVSGAQGPTYGSGVSGVASGGGVRALAAPTTTASAGGGLFGGTADKLLLAGASGISGQLNSEAALEAAEQQAQGIQDGINANTAALQPYTQLGQEATSRIGEIQADPAAYIQSNELYGSLANDAERRLLANQAARGKVGSGGTSAALQEQLLNIGTGLVNTEIGNLQSQASLGGQAASQVGSTSYQGNAAIGNANAAGTIGSNGALTSSYQNMINTVLASNGNNQAPTYTQPINL